MMIAVLGMPSAFAAWGFELVRRLAQVARPGMEPLWVDRLDPFEQDQALPRLVLSQFPSRPLRQLLSKGGIPLVLFIASGIDALRYQRQHQPPLLEAVRTVGASVALIGDCDPQEQALILDASEIISAEEAIRAIVSHLQCDIGDGVIGDLLAAIGPMPIPDIATEPTFGSSDDGIVTLVLENAIAHLRDPAVALKSIWPHRVFFAGDRPNEEAPLVVDATGGSRVLYYGPYFHLAEGRWRAKMTLGFTKEAVGLPLKVSAYGPGLLGEARVKPRQEGIFAAQFTFTVSEPEHPVEFHVKTEEGAIEGRIALGQAELSHLGRHHGGEH